MPLLWLWFTNDFEIYITKKPILGKALSKICKLLSYIFRKYLGYD
jgi:hypothetical protein